MLFTCSRIHGSFNAPNINDAVFISLEKLRVQEGLDTLKITSAPVNDQWCAVSATGTTSKEVMRGGELVEVEETEKLQFMVRPFSHIS